MAARSCLVLVLFAGHGAIAPAFAELIGADEVLRRLEKNVAGAQLQVMSKPAELLGDIRRFRAEAATMEPRKAAEAWLALFDRAAAVGPLGMESGDYRAYDAEARGMVSVQSVFAALPAPDAWPMLREAAAARAKRTPDQRALTLRLIGEFLVGDRAASAATLSALDSEAGRLPPQERELIRMQLAYLRAERARLYGSREEVAAAFVSSVEAQRRAYGGIPVPDLVGLVGEARAEAILRDALSRPVQFSVPEGDRTRALARRIALERIETLPLAQWGLVDSIDAADLYEALQRRFGAKGTGSPEERFAFPKGDADAYYFLHLVIAGRHDAAEQALRAAFGDAQLELPRRAVEALEKAGQNEALFRFLHALLGRHPELRAWEVYMKQAAYTGHSADALTLVERLLQRKELPDYVLADLRFQRVNALLAADKVDPAVTALRELLAAPPKADERTLQARSQAAVRLAGLGRVLGRRDLSRAGLDFARAVLALPPDRERAWQREELLKSVFAEQRKQGLAEQAQQLAMAELEQGAGTPNEQEQFGLGAPSNERAALIELAGLYGAAQRHKDVIVLMDRSTKWGARDLSALAGEKDSLGVPVGLTAARALARTGNREAALAIARALIEHLPGYDGSYELLVDLDPDASAYLNTVYLRDRFEERPLIWMAIALHRQGRDTEAENLIRQAIVIDPSDGEEGPNDRMRAYAVLAEILEAKGAKPEAATFRRAVDAIRISERADDLHRVGLYQRAVAGYREALGQFADAYCIQSRLALRLHEQGRREEAYEHYRRAYELMPVSFGRVESHCFGCESVFQGTAQQGIAEKVFNDLLAKEPNRPQLHYLLGYLQQERGIYDDALKRFQQSVQLDPEYLNAWKHLHELARHVYIEPRARDIARFKLLQLDPAKRHVRYDLDRVGDLAELWRAVAAANTAYKAAPAGALYALRGSAASIEAAQSKLPEQIRAQIEQFQTMDKPEEGSGLLKPHQALGRHTLLRASASLLGAREFGMR